ncbi:TPA: hypothetical protein PWY45_002243 [Mannheimia haemolytica]|uniref:Uncharacterized protein n=1 Tax=Mannheimia haemolytica TaxID=75985 RepID=A0A378NDV6_MANHA|nr:hypothetical protein [Mannheimia haemolytica]AGQ38662.1 hypothetical protein J450_05820 [Mannheimia haemolytica D171]EEY12544.1 hypothetical protein COK_1353 [Mannheimia haemolytica serotype A2 str. BOVINE]KYL13629.1 hypothetical protein AC571_12040 [Mannheimia haemolytica]KYL21345.1 hypothetical protein AC574_11115 [Mannheimia haemolytica]MDW0536237.1 hypothetical protein [Mannheimia haemolytica]
MTNQKFINSSLTLAFFTLISFSTAYCYAWGIAAFHGYPWWHVEVGNAGIARALAYVFGTFLTIFLFYLIGYALVNKVFKLHYFKYLGWLRVSVLVTIFSLPVMISFYLFIGKVPMYLHLLYLGTTTLSVLLFHKHWDHRVFHLDIQKMLSEERFGFFYVFIFIYFSLLSLSIGYIRPELRTTYDYLEIENKRYYVLSIHRNNIYVLGEKTKDNDEFLFFNQDTLKYYRINITKMPN